MSLRTRIQLKHDTEAHYNLATGFSPLPGELIIYDIDDTHSSPRFKVGDGTTNVNELPFITFDYTETDPTVPAWAKAATKPTYTAQEVGALPSSTVIPTKTSDLTNDSGFLTAHQDISGKADKSATVSNVAYDTTNKKITKTINGITSDVVSAATLKTDMSLSNVDNKSSATIRSEITSSNVTTALGFTPLDASLKGANSGIAELDSNGKVPSSQLPSYVDDVLEYSAKSSFPATGETGKIYVDTSTNKTYRWSGSDYVEISASLALGTTSSTAYRGDYGNDAYTHAVTNKGSAFSSGLYKITTNSEGHVTAATAVAKSDITSLGIPGEDTDTHRVIQVNGTQALGNNTTALNLKAGSNVTITDDGSGAITIAATDTNTWRPVSDSISSTSSSDAASSKAVKTAYDLAASKTANTGTVTSVAAGTGLSGGTITTSGTLSVTYGSTAGTACQGNDSRLSDSRNAKDVYSWAKASTKPSYTYSEVGAMVAPVIITTSNTSVSDALTYGTAITPVAGQLFFIILNKAMSGSANATIKFGSNTALNLYKTNTSQLKAAFSENVILGFVYTGSKLVMINPPMAI